MNTSMKLPLELTPQLLARSLALAALSVPAAAQSTIRVPQDQPTIQAGITAAIDGDTVLVFPGTYVEQIDYLGKAITLTSTGGAAVTTIDSQGMDNWIDYPYGAVVRMINGEGPASVLEGFTVTGGDSGAAGNGGYSGIFCVGLSPTVRDCIIRDNSGGLGGGVNGNPVLERCQIINNDALPYGPGGGVYGEPSIVECVIKGNRSGDRGGGVYATGPCKIYDSVIDGNESGNGFDGYSGGGVFGPATIVSTVLSNNTANHYLSGGPPDEIGTAADGAVLLDRCTVVGNRIGNPQVGDPGGALKNVSTVQNSILWGNENLPLADGSTPSISYSIITGGHVGTGNSSADPLFRDEPAGDYFLQLGSPAIDAGDPAASNDPDGTRADMGAIFFPQFPAAVVSRNGNGVNPFCYTTVGLPFIGAGMDFDVDATAHGLPATLTFLVFYDAPAPVPLPTVYGEVLVDPFSTQVVTSTSVVVAGSSAHSIFVPADYSLGGMQFSSQAIVFGGGVGLCNALDVTLGL